MVAYSITPNGDNFPNQQYDLAGEAIQISKYLRKLEQQGKTWYALGASSTKVSNPKLQTSAKTSSDAVLQQNVQKQELASAEEEICITCIRSRANLAKGEACIAYLRPKGMWSQEGGRACGLRRQRGERARGPRVMRTPRGNRGSWEGVQAQGAEPRGEKLGLCTCEQEEKERGELTCASHERKESHWLQIGKFPIRILL